MSKFVEILNKRSALNFVVFVAFALGMTIFILNKAEQAIEEIKRLNDAPVYLGQRSLEE